MDVLTRRQQTSKTQHHDVANNGVGDGFHWWKGKNNQEKSKINKPRKTKITWKIVNELKTQIRNRKYKLNNREINDKIPSYLVLVQSTLVIKEGEAIKVTEAREFYLSK